MVEALMAFNDLSYVPLPERIQWTFFSTWNEPYLLREPLKDGYCNKRDCVTTVWFQLVKQWKDVLLDSL